MGYRMELLRSKDPPPQNEGVPPWVSFGLPFGGSTELWEGVDFGVLGAGRVGGRGVGLYSILV